jgi:hypothetical protein
MLKEWATKCRREAEVLHIERNNWYSEHKGAFRFNLIAHLSSQHSLDISPIWTPIIEKELANQSSVQFDASTLRWVHAGIM